MFINALTGPTSGGAQGSEQIQQGESAKSRKGASFDAVMEETAKSADGAETDATQVEETAEGQTSTTATSEKANQKAQDDNAEAQPGEDQVAAEPLAADPETAATHAQSAAEQEAADEALRDTEAAGEHAIEADGSTKISGEMAKVTIDPALEGEGSSPSPSVDGNRDATAKVQIVGAGSKMVLPADGSSAIASSDGSKSSTASADTTNVSQSAVVDSEAAVSNVMRGETTDKKVAGDAANRGKATAVSELASGVTSQSTRIVQANVAHAATEGAKLTNAELAALSQSNASRETVATPGPVQSQQAESAVRSANAIPVEAVSSPIRDKFEARRAAADEKSVSPPTKTTLPQGTYSAASFGLGAGSLTAAMPNSTSLLSGDPTALGDSGSAVATGGRTGTEMAGLSQLLTEATVSPGTVHKPETPRLIANQMAEALATKGERNVDVALNPKELGHVNMRVSVTDTGVSVMIQTERAETGDLMKRHINELADEFRRMGFEDISFQFSGDEASNRGGGNDTSGNHSGQSARLDGDVDDMPAEPIAQSLNLGEVGLDMRI
ncbi:flagellar hook-length control protein FliK [Phaeobacter sp. C3_T13_0]|uniref:flagellar hook-length control protein FliK n=1 Tax=Phaeobacter cretensis TaxID=3342641 RepID=UPI0039BC2FE0